MWRQNRSVGPLRRGAAELGTYLEDGWLLTCHHQVVTLE